MILNIIDRRKRRYRWKNITAITEATCHDNSCADSDQAEPNVSGIGYDEWEDVSLAVAIKLADSLTYDATLYLYDLGDGIRIVTDTEMVSRAATAPDAIRRAAVEECATTDRCFKCDGGLLTICPACNPFTTPGQIKWQQEAIARRDAKIAALTKALTGTIRNALVTASMGVKVGSDIHVVCRTAIEICTALATNAMDGLSPQETKP